MNVTLNKGGTKERIVDITDVEIPELKWHDPAIVGCHSLLRIAHSAIIHGGHDVELWESIRVPDLWHIADANETNREDILAVWHLTHDLVRTLAEKE